MSKAITPILALVAVGSTAFSVVQWNARTAAEAASAERDSRLAALEQSLKDALAAASKAKDALNSEAENVARLTKERDDAKEASKQVAAAAAGAAGVSAPTAADAKPQFDIRNVMGNIAKGFDDPEQRKAMRSMGERMVGGAYEKMFKDMGLNEADTKLVTEIIGERNFVAMDRGRKLLTGKADEAAVAEVRKDIAVAKTEYDSKLKAVLGNEKYNDFTAYEQTVGDRRTLDSLARDFERKGQALDDTQRAQLMKIMTEERLKNPSNDIPDLGGGPGMQMLMSDAEAQAQQKKEQEYQSRVASRAAQAGLSPDQVSTLQESQKRRNEQMTLGRTMGRAFLMPK